MMTFSKAEYVVTGHLIEQFKNRVGYSHEKDILQMLKQGTVILETDTHRYVQYQNLRFPCVKTPEGKYYAKSVITEGMFMNPQ